MNKAKLIANILRGSSFMILISSILAGVRWIMSWIKGLLPNPVRS